MFIYKSTHNAIIKVYQEDVERLRKELYIVNNFRPLLEKLTEVGKNYMTASDGWVGNYVLDGMPVATP